MRTTSASKKCRSVNNRIITSTDYEGLYMFAYELVFSEDRKK
jgi:hypothetical protein